MTMTDDFSRIMHVNAGKDQVIVSKEVGASTVTLGAFMKNGLVHRTRLSPFETAKLILTLWDALDQFREDQRVHTPGQLLRYAREHFDQGGR